MKLGLPQAKLTLKQLNSNGARRVRLFSQIIGVTIGCLLGMWPLLFVNVERRNLKESFDDADLDKSGKLSPYELTMALHRSGLMMDPSEIDWLVKRCGKDGERLTFDEFVVLVQHWNEFNHEYLSMVANEQVETILIDGSGSNIISGGGGGGGASSGMSMSGGVGHNGSTKGGKSTASVSGSGMRIVTHGSSSSSSSSSHHDSPSPSHTSPKPKDLVSQILFTKYKV
jgi:hypothetical protein